MLEEVTHFGLVLDLVHPDAVHALGSITGPKTIAIPRAALSNQ
jgi:hypothetical protein